MKRYVCGFCFMLMGIALLAGQQKITIDRAIQEAQKKIERELPEGTKIIVLNFDAPAGLSDYVLDKLANGIINSKKLIVIERKELNLIRQELIYQYSGDVSDEEIRSLGRQYGAQSIVSGKFNELLYGFSIKVINVENAMVEVSYQANIRKEQKLDTLIGTTEPKKPVKTQTVSQPKPVFIERKTKFILGLRGGVTFMLNDPNSFKGFENQQGQAFAAYFGTNNLTSLTGFQVEANVIMNNGIQAKKSEDSAVFSYTSLDIPLLLRLGIVDAGMISIFGGPYLSMPLSKLTMHTVEYKIDPFLSFMSSYGILGGLSVGLRVGPGIITLDGRYMYDFNEIAYKDAGDNSHSLFRRHGINLTVGYEFWL